MPVPPPLVVPPLPAPLSNADIANCLQTLYSAPSTLAQYSCFFFLQEFSNDDFLGSVGYAMEYPDTDVLIQKFYQYVPDQAVQLYVHSISAMETGAASIFSGNSQPYQVFISLDKIALASGAAKQLVPYQTAKLLSAAFIHGLVTRLLLDRYKQVWSNAKPNPVPLWTDLPLVAAPPIGPNPHPVSTPMNAAAWAASYINALTSNLTKPLTWTTTSSQHGNLNYLGCLNILTDSSLQAAGMITGWLAGDAITDPAFGAANTTACQKAIWSLLGNAYTYVDIGTLVGYTFTYLNGFILSERTKAAISANPLPTAANNPTTGPAAIYTYLSTNTVNQVNFTPLATAFFNFIVAEFYAIAGTNLVNAAKYEAFIEGFAKGLLIGANSLFGELFEEGFQLGYTTGFNVGYEQGYSAGWTEGYAVGYQQGQNTWMSGLQSIISGASGTSGLSGLLSDAGTLSTLLNDATTVGTAIASLF
jgi:hypothetical protein